VAACTLALSPIRDTLIEGFSHFVTSMTAPIASGWSESPGGACTHWKAPPCHGAHPQRHIALGAGDKAATGVGQTAPPGIINIGFVEDVSDAGLDRLVAADHDVVDGCRGDLQAHRPIGVGS